MIELKPAINEVKLTLKSISSPINLGTVVEPVSGGSVPTDVRQAIYTLLENAAYATTGLEDEIAIVQAWAQEVTALSLSATSLTIEGETPQTLTATVVPDGSTVLWSSSDESVATVSGGVVTGTGNGSCVITATAGNLTAHCAVTVSGSAELVSISAAYTQSGTVYDTDSLDSLKTDLVVTATYSDTSTETIPSTDYTLSGTLEVGTSTITVTYSGKTTTFSVMVTDFLASIQFEAYPWARVGGSGSIKEYVYKNSSTSARARSSVAFKNNGYTFSVVDGTKYNIVVYNVTDPTVQTITLPGTSTQVEAVSGVDNNKSWGTSGTSSSPYVALSFKKLDNTNFTATELENMFGTVFTATRS